MYAALLSGLFRLSQLAVWFGGALMLVAAIMVSVDVIARKFLGASLGGSDEISGYLFAISTAFALPYAALHRANVRIDVVYALLPRPVRAGLDLFGLACLSLFAAMVTWRALAMLAVTWRDNAHSITPLHTPLIIPQGLWVAGWCLFCLSLAVLLYGAVAALLAGRLERVQALVGARSMEDEIEKETEGLVPAQKAPGSAPYAVSSGE